MINIPGNILILVSSLKYKAIKLDKITIIFIQNIAICDLGTAVFGLSTHFSSVIFGRWIYGSILCQIRPTLIVPTFTGAAILFVAAMNVSKLTSLLDPFGARIRTNRTGYFTSILVWSVAPILNVLVNIISFVQTGSYGNYSGTYNSEIFTCFNDFDNNIYNTKMVVFVFIPITTIIVTTIWLLRFLDRERGLNRQTVTTLIAISTIFFISIIPFAFNPVFKLLITPENYVYYRRFSGSIINILFEQCGEPYRILCDCNKFQELCKPFNKQG